MPEFNYNLEDLNDTSSIAKKSAENFYNGQVAPLKTSLAQNGDMQRTLTQRDLQEVLSGDALYRSPNFALQISTNNVQSSINNILANGAATDAQDLTISDPNSEDPNSKLKGKDAFNQIIASSALGKVGLGYGITNYAANIEEANFTDPQNPGSDNHADSSGSSFDPTKGGSAEFRLITVKENLTNEEQAVFTQRLEDLKKTAIISDKVYNFTGVGFSNLDPNATIKATDSRDIGTSGALYISTREDYAKYNGKTILPCASLIECLIYLNTKLKIRGSFDFGRGWIRAGGGDLTTGTLNDHVCGRGIDITHIGIDENNMINLKTGNEANYRQAMELLLPVLESMDPSIHPDLLAVDDRLAKDYGLASGTYEIDPNKGVNLNGILQKKYRSLRRIDFNPDSGHRDHIHLSFGPERAGTYLDWVENTTPKTGSTDSTVNVNPGLVRGDPVSKIEIFESFYNTNKKISNTNALYRALIDYGNFGPEVAALFMCISERESNFGPSSFAIDSDDYSLGLFQTNYSDTTKSTFISRDVTILSLNSSDRTGKPKSKKYPLWKLLLTNWEELGIKNGTEATAKIKEYRLAGKGREFADPRLFMPVNQIQLLVSYVQDYPSRWKFRNWGEYENGPSYGWITKLKFETAVQFYVENNPGKTRKDLIDFCNHKTFWDNMVIPESKVNYVQWLNGETFGFS